MGSGKWHEIAVEFNANRISEEGRRNEIQIKNRVKCLLKQKRNREEFGLSRISIKESEK